MHPLVLEVLAKQHIEDLHREAQRQRLVGAKRKRQSDRHPGIGGWDPASARSDLEVMQSE